MAGKNIKIKKPAESICVTLRLSLPEIKINERLEELENEVYSNDQQIETMYDRIDELEKNVGSDERDEDDG
ncbi:MAG: hypothetical protein Q9203_006356 [Teloschistes exilis]